VLFKTPISEIEALIADFLQQGAPKVFVIDNSVFTAIASMTPSSFTAKLRACCVPADCYSFAHSRTEPGEREQVFKWRRILGIALWVPRRERDCSD